ncbi:SDR family NAD(P)-dependent oxidoreductase [Arthrobacter sp. NamB2]|uniref:SDR family NAD(P)-dependent oxidoreductase n=1 Tax=Arthrobacter sp. NamB2 TaxID=2576035 RepID=UPI0010C980FC|nr:SDR family NAD(P)-dependent oxidoreductase [Arthrobacter sp. NamB2]TKV26136.1 SDR family NAD(P)-dependent oxidoreductase [Arthrobacter sp. NamB2]
MDVGNRTGVITGAGTGIGRALAVDFGRHNGNLLLVGRRTEPLEETADMVRAAGGQAEVFAADITEPGVIDRVTGTARPRGPVDLLVNNAGNVRADHLEDLPEQDVLAMINLNLTAPILLTRALLPSLKGASAERGSILLAISSGIALTGLPFYTVYAATKSGIAHFGKALRREVHGTGVHVATAFPGATDTDMMTSSSAGEDLGFGRRPVADVVTEILESLTAGDHEINTAATTRRKMQDLNKTDPLAVDALLAPKLAALETAVSTHRSI